MIISKSMIFEISILKTEAGAARGSRERAGRAINEDAQHADVCSNLRQKIKAVKSEAESVKQSTDLLHDKWKNMKKETEILKSLINKI